MDSVQEAYNFYHTVSTVGTCLVFMLLPTVMIMGLAYNCYSRDGSENAFGLLAVSFVPFFAIFALYFSLPDSELLHAAVEKQISLVNKDKLNCTEQVLLANIISHLPKSTAANVDDKMEKR